MFAYLLFRKESNSKFSREYPSKYQAIAQKFQPKQMTIISQKNAEFHTLKHFFFMTILIRLGTNATLNHDMRY